MAYAQWLEDRKDVRGEFLKLQIKLKTPRLSAAEKRKAKKRLEALEQEIDREWLKKVTVVPAVKCDRDWASWNSLETLNEHKLGRNRKVPVDAIVVSKSKEWVHDAEVVRKNLKPNDFNEVFLRVIGNRITVKLNGVITVDKKVDGLPKSGLIGFELHHGKGKTAQLFIRDVQFKAVN